MIKLNNKLSVIIPCFNEENYIGNLLSELLKEVNPGEIIVVDDFSTDNSVNIINSIKDQRIKLVTNEKNMGKGYCIIQGLKNAQKEIILVQDADPEYSPKDINFLLSPFFDADADFVIGTRSPTTYRSIIGYFYPTILNKLITFLVNFKYNTNFSDVECGYTSFTKAILKEFTLNENKFGIEL